MVAVLDRVPLQRIRVEAARIEPRAAVLALSKALLACLAFLLYAVGWLPARSVRLVLLAVAWTAAALKIGWKDGLANGPDRQDQSLTR